MAISEECLKKIMYRKIYGPENIMSSHPKTIDPDELAVNALDIMRKA